MRRMTRPDGSDEGALPPIELYKMAVDEYRFQAEFNWKRTQYLLAFNAAVLAAGAAVAGRFGQFAVPVFGLGIVACLLAIQVQRQQHDYYRAARDRMRRLELDLQVVEPVDTTSTLGKRPRFISVTALIYLLTAAIAVAHLIGLVYSVTA